MTGRTLAERVIDNAVLTERMRTVQAESNATYGEQMTTALVLSALNMALQQGTPDGVIHHMRSRRPVHEHRVRRPVARKMGVRASMGTAGDAYDNAMAESFFATLSAS